MESYSRSRNIASEYTICRGGQANFYKKVRQSQTTKLGPIAYPQVLRCVSSQIANPKIFMINLQIARKFP
jgi:hypothetical protein